MPITINSFYYKNSSGSYINCLPGFPSVATKPLTAYVAGINNENVTIAFSGNGYYSQSIQVSIPYNIYSGPSIIYPSPSTENIPAYTYFPYSVTIPSEPNLKPENIAPGVTILGVTGAEVEDSSDYEKRFIEQDKLNSTIFETLGYSKADIVAKDGMQYTTYYTLSSSILNDSDITRVGAYTFYSNATITSINYPQCNYIGNGGFYNCKNLTTINFPMCNIIEVNAFANCSNLITVSIPQCHYIQAGAFNNCINLTTVYLNQTSSVCKLLNSQVFNNCSNLISIYVPLSLIDNYKQDNTWQYFSNKIIGI